MNKAVLILIGAAIGCLITLLATSLYEHNQKKKMEYAIETIHDIYTMVTEPADIQYIEVVGKKGRATIHNGMSKDSVKILLGKPDRADMRTSLGTVHENWKYEINDDYSLNLDFEDGMLTNVNQY